MELRLGIFALGALAAEVSATSAVMDRARQRSLTGINLVVLIAALVIAAGGRLFGCRPTTGACALEAISPRTSRLSISFSVRIFESVNELLSDSTQPDRVLLGNAAQRDIRRKPRVGYASEAFRFFGKSKAPAAQPGGPRGGVASASRQRLALSPLRCSPTTARSADQL